MLNLVLSVVTYLAVVNTTAYFLMYRDKQKAQQHQFRIAEKYFFLLCIFGGFIGIHLAMQNFRHKTLHLSFKSAVIFSAVLWILILPYGLMEYFY